MLIINSTIWNLNGFDKAGSFAGETTNVATTYPRGIFFGLVMCVFGFLIPLLVAVGATDYSQAEWVDGHLGVVAVDIGGQWLGVWTIFAAGISNVALFEAEMSSDAFKIMGMAERGYLPKWFKARSKYGTPTAGILTNTIVIIALGTADFGQLLELLNCTYIVSVLLEHAAFVKLRLYHKDCKFLRSLYFVFSDCWRKIHHCFALQYNDRIVSLYPTGLQFYLLFRPR